MHLVTVLTIIFVIFLLITLCGWCCKNGTKEQQGTTFTTVVAMPQPAMQNSTACNMPYPTNTNMMPQPHMMGAAIAPPVGHIGFTPYPQMGYPPQQPAFVGGAPFSPYPGYPPQANSATQQNPPSYAEATAPQAFGNQPATNPNFR